MWYFSLTFQECNVLFLPRHPVSVVYIRATTHTQAYPHSELLTYQTTACTQFFPPSSRVDNLIWQGDKLSRLQLTLLVVKMCLTFCRQFHWALSDSSSSNLRCCFDVCKYISLENCGGCWSVCYCFWCQCRAVRIHRNAGHPLSTVEGTIGFYQRV